MNRKGFTLVEIIAVIVIMGILLLIVVPTTSNLMRSNEEREYTTYYEMVEAGLEKYARTRREEVGGTLTAGCIDDKILSDMIRLGYVKKFDQEKDIFCGTPNEFDTALLESWGVDTTKEYANMRVEGDHGKITTKLSLICVKMNEDGTYYEEPEYIKVLEGGECTPSAGLPPDPPTPPPTPTPDPDPNPVYYTITYNKNGGTSCTKTTDSLTTGQSVDLTPTCTRSGYTFGGWAKSSGGVRLSSLTVEDQDITLYAKWTANSSGGGGGGCWSAVTASNSFGEDYNHLIVHRNNRTTPVSTWTNQPVSFKVQHSGTGVVYATWEYSGANVEIRSETRRFDHLPPSGSDYFEVVTCVYYDSKKPTVELRDVCYEYPVQTGLFTSMTIIDNGSQIGSVTLNGEAKTECTDKTRCMISSEIIPYRSYGSRAKPFTLVVCDKAGNCETIVHTTPNTALSDSECP